MSPAHQPGDDRPRGSGDRSGGSPGGLTPTEWADALHLAALQARAEAARRERPVFPAPPADGRPPGEASASGTPPGEAGLRADAPGSAEPCPPPGTDTGTARPPGLPDGGAAAAGSGPATGHDPRERPPDPPPGRERTPPRERRDPGDGRPPTEPHGFVQPVLHRRQELVAALGPFHLTEPRGRPDGIDPEGTARNYARALLDSLHWPEDEREDVGVPVVPRPRARRERVADLTLLVDDGVTMAFQRGLAAEFVRLARSGGIFREVASLYFDSGRTGSPRLRDGHGRPGRLGGGRAHVVLFLTDGLGGAWRDRGFQDWVAAAAGRGAVAILHLLQPRLWRRGGIATAPMELGAPGAAGPCAANTRYARERTLTDPEEEGRAQGALVPVLPLDPRTIRDWAVFAMGRGRGRLWAHTARFPAGEDPAPAEAPDAWDPGFDAEREARRFRQLASPEAFDLAVALAAVPLDPRLVEAVCEDVLGRATPSELTEVFFSGLVRGAGGREEDGPVGWDFRPGVRRALLSLGGRVSDIRRVLGLAAERLRWVDPWFDALRLMLRGRHDDLPKRTRVSHHWANSMLPAVESAALTRRYAEPIREYADISGTGATRGAQETQEAGTPSPAGLVLPKVSGSARVGGNNGWKARNRTPFSERSGKETHMATKLSNEDIMQESGDQSSGRTSRSSTSGRPLNAVWVQVPRRNSAFTGREELLSALRGQLLKGRRQVITALNGMSGVGKTELAKEYLYRYASDYDLICWIPAAHSNQLRESFSVLASRLRLDSAGAGSGHVLENVLEALRQGVEYPRWLLVFDNAQARSELDQYLPVGGEGHVIITSRDSSWTVRGGDAYLSVREFDRAESIELLKRRGPASLSDEEADQLAHELGDLPLALNQAAVWLHESGMATEEYLRQFAEKSQEMLDLLRPVDSAYPVAVAAAWNVSLDRLATTNPAALQLLQLCSFMATAPIPRTLFNFARGIEGPAELRGALEDPARLGMAIRDIGRNSLAHIDHQRNTVSLHRLVQRAVQAPMSDEEREEMRHCAHQLLGRNDLQVVDVDASQRYTELLPHVWASELWNCTDPWARNLVVQTCRVATLRQEFDDARRLGETAHEWWRLQLGENHPSTLGMAIQISTAMRGQGYLEQALALCESTLGTLRETQNPEDPETLEAEIEHIRTLRFLGRFRDSLTAAADAYHRRVRLFGEDDPHTLVTAHFRAFNLLLSGDPEAATDQYRDTLARLEAVFGPDHPRTLGTNNGYAEALMEKGRYREAEEIQAHQVERAIGLIGEDDNRVLRNQRTLAVMRRRVGHHREALVLSERAWQRFRVKHGVDDNETMYAALVHSMSLSAVNQHDEALELAQTTGERYVKLLGERHPYVGAADVNRAIILRRLGRAAEARQLDERSLELFLDRLGTHHPSTLACLVNLANDHFLMGDAAGARERDEEALRGCEEALGAAHPLTLLARRNLLVDRRAQGEDVDAGFVAVEDGYREVMGSDHPATLSLRRTVRGDADIYLAQM
ncbi:FxSxx-COOH system tetratricopeptide repeat protein [Nocardiopsis alborubida]|uniref:Tetratricopeptide repeat protein n=1 Tax=Nocardiopsis alborubida TaxID=146802 RepID=A0A7X6M7J0_9ACTN|nr:FxSxx-COOH system tetratricopeptide repeat protein [Nocardiopsis alborubida]NKY96117.1 tetratricopeptide repeat protein [Nocardiopsis alborubida]